MRKGFYNRGVKKYILKNPPKQAALDTFRAAYQSSLNEQQFQVATAPDGPALVIAGAGSGKTRTLIYRLAWLVHCGVAPESILLLTFTRRAAHEMLKRAAQLLDDRCQRVSGGTFHSVGAAILRRYGKPLGLSSSFTILDRSDAEDVIQLLRGEMGLAEKGKRFPKKGTLSDLFSKVQNKLLTLDEVVEAEYRHFTDQVELIRSLFIRYQKYKTDRHLVDYDDLLVDLYALLSEHEAIRQTLAEQYRHLLVDEYQDTNKIQGEIVRLLGRDGRVMAVGDDAQSIYSFRGADFQNILRFPQSFPGTQVYKLEENYRSTQAVLDLANAVIAESRHQYPKHLFTRKQGGMKPALVRAQDESEQSRFVAQKILELREEGIPLSEIAVLFRSSFHSFDLEIELARCNLPFEKRGGFKLVETAHVKDLMSHLRVLINPSDAVSWNRLLLLIPGIGPRTSQKMIATVQQEGRESLRGFARGAQAESIQRLLEMLSQAEGADSMTGQIERAMEYYLPLMKNRYDDHPKRTKDLEHLLLIAERYRTLSRFLSDLALEPEASVLDVAPTDADQEKLVLSTIHSAKGLEWKAVFILWALDGYFPSIYSFTHEAELDEERRLMYVAVTRAQEQLYLTYPIRVFHRASHAVLTKPSRFIESVPEEILEPWVLSEEG
ncbi:MAG: ATP-dependent helicase [Candidatus Manganitrophaceae bacterium]|nr:MAG: ATP-dependent helicase [Candidatus Manganitrophaceae bacterium]